MNSHDFTLYQENAVTQFYTLLRSNPPGTFDENGLPAYTNPNPLMRWLFWQRVLEVTRIVDRIPTLTRALDFGCGLGVMLPYLSAKAKEVVGVDLDTSLVSSLARQQNLQNVRFENDLGRLLGDGLSFDLILAMDVLEHVDHLDEYVKDLRTLSSPTATVVITGPTENYLYKIGRALAGYSGHYHVRNIYDIRNSFEKVFSCRVSKTLVPLFPFFLVLEGKPI